MDTRVKQRLISLLVQYLILAPQHKIPSSSPGCDVYSCGQYALIPAEKYVIAATELC